MTVKDGLNKVKELDDLAEDLNKLCGYMETGWLQDERDGLTKNAGLKLPVHILLGRARNTIAIRRDEINESIMNTELDASSIKLP